MTEHDDDFLLKLKQLCLEFDSKAEAYPDFDYVGFAIYYYATHPGCNPNPTMASKIDTGFCEGGKEWIIDLDKMTKHEEVTTLQLPNNHFLFHITTEERDNIIKSFYTPRIFKKSEFFKDKKPGWLAESFVITEIKPESGTEGMVEIYPLDELYVVDPRTLIVIENKEKHETVGMIIYS